MARLERELAEAIEQQVATSQVLEVIGRSDFRLERVFETLVRHAVRLGRADCGYVYRLDGDVYRIAFIVGGSHEYREFMQRHPVKQGPETLVGRVGLERRIVQIPDVLADPIYRWPTGRELGGYRTMLGAPMLVGDQVVGVLILWRLEVDPFGERTIDLLTTFAAQAAIAIRNVQLFRDLTRSVDELRALGEISQAVSSSLDLDEVLTTIVTRAVQLSGTEGGSIFEFDQATRLFHLRTSFGTERELVRALRATRIHIDETFLGRAAASGEPQSAADLSLDASDPHIERLASAGWRSMLVVPLRWEHEIIGALVVHRRIPGAFSAGTAELLETLASESAVAIHNARLFRQLEEKSRQLEVASRHKSEFLASMSHELRTPLNAVIGFSDVLLERMFGDLNERQEEYVRDIRDSGRHLLELINEILDLSKVEAGQMELEPAALSLPDLLEHGMAMVRERAANHGIALSLTVAPEVGVVWADEVKLKQVVLNLLTNAVKFTPDGGSVDVKAEVVDGEAHVIVADTGVGITEADQAIIFEAFQRGGRKARAGTEGTGLGLTLSKRIIELHGGRIWLESRPAEGSTFGFAIAVGAQDVAPEPPVAGDRAVDGSGTETVLLVEDDPHSAELLALYLEGAGYRVAHARDGAAGLELARRLRPRAVVLDILLPRVDGWELLARLKADAVTAACPVVVVSMLDERGKGFALGAAEYLLKPVSREEMLEALARCLPAGAERATVLVIDDDPVDRRLVVAALEPAGYQVVTAAGGEEGLALIRRERPAVVLLDLLMPDVDGFAVIEEVRADPAIADVPIVVLTAQEMLPGDRERLAGRISFLAQKGSFGRAELVGLVGRLARTEELL